MGGANNAVSAMSAYLVNAAAANQNASYVAGSKKDLTKAAATSFDNILGRVSDNFVKTQMADVSKDVNKAQDAKETFETDTKATSFNTGSENSAGAALENARADQTVNDPDAEKMTANETVSDEPNAELFEAISKAGEEIISEIAETFDISEEEIVDAMQILGLMAADLLNPANITQLVTEISGQEEAIDLITDSDIYTSLQDLMEGAESMKSELMNEFDLSEQELQTAIENSGSDFEGILKDAQNEQTAEFIRQDIPDPFEEVPDKNKMTTPVSEAFETSETVEEKPVVVETENQKSGDNKENLQNDAQPANLFNQVVSNIADAAAQTEAVSYDSYADRAQMENIIRQITERITISQSQTDTSIEMQLHPASLGHVNILLTSGKDGIVAKFTAQNEIVKEAVEAQMAQLQQKFNEQGIKVTSVEVTIASHGFEQNLDQQGDRQDGNTAKNSKVKGLRRINLSQIEDDEDGEPESEAERIAVSMMEANGNTVDFSA